MSFIDQYGPWALIAGASEGTGASFARQLAHRGLNLVLIARREAPLVALAEEIRRSFSVDCVTTSIDLGRDDASSKVIEAVGSREIGLFINNAGGDPFNSTFLDGELKNWETLVHLDVMTVMRNCHHFGRLMRERRRGGIILVGSGACYGGITGKGLYCGVKAFDLCFGEGLWAELRNYGVDVLNLVLGQTDTPEYRRVLAELGLSVPTHLANPDDVAALGLTRLPHGPVCNWGSSDDEPGFAPTSPAQRRTRILAIEAASQSYTRKV
jgi:short-subunit dehydrogenase